MTRGLGIVGNCSFSALLDRGSVEWLCWPRPDSSFVVGPLLDRERGGAFVSRGRRRDRGDPGVRREHERPPHASSPVAGGLFELLDFAPRFMLYDRRVQADDARPHPAPAGGRAAGAASAAARCTATAQTVAGSWRASNHIEYTDLPAPVRLTTNVPLSIRRGGAAVPARARPPPRADLGRAARGRASRRPRSASSSARSTTGAAG